MKSRSRAIFTAAVILVSSSVLAVVCSTLSLFVDHPVRDISHDIDWAYLNRGLDQIHSFRDTLRWWTGTWCGVVPFWRPLTSYVYWVERLLWPKEYMLPREIVVIAMHLIFVAMAGYLTWCLTKRRWLALLTVWLFSGFRPFPINGFFGYNPAVYDACGNPENFHEPLAGIAMLLSLVLLARGRWLASLGLAMVSVGFKETGFMTWPMALLTLAWINRQSKDRVPVLSAIRRHRLPILAWSAGFVALAVVHYLAVGFGYRIGANGAWLGRAELYFGGPVGKQFVLDDPSPAVFAFLVFAVIVCSRKLSLLPRFMCVMAAMTIGVLLDTHIQHTTWDSSAARLLTYGLDLKVVLLCLFWLLVAWEARHDWRTVGFCLGLCLIGTFPTWVASQTREHTRYMASYFMEMAVAATLLSALNHARGAVDGKLG